MHVNRFKNRINRLFDYVRGEACGARAVPVRTVRAHATGPQTTVRNERGRLSDHLERIICGRAYVPIMNWFCFFIGQVWQPLPGGFLGMRKLVTLDS